MNNSTADTLNEYDSDTFEVGNARLRLRSDWLFVMSAQTDPPTYLLSNPEQSEHFEIGWAQYALLSLMNGRRTLIESVSLLSDRASDHALSTDQAVASAQWALRIGLAEAVNAQGRPIQFRESTSDSRAAKSGKWSNPLFLKVPLGDPSESLAKSVTFSQVVQRLGRIACSGPVIALWICLQLFALATVSLHWSAILQSSAAIMDPWSGPWLLVTFVGLKLVHEFGHAAVCHAFGGRVRETGLMFTLFVPIPYVDVSASWMFQDRWQRMAVAAAGMFVELTIAAIATIAWSQTDDTRVQFHLFNIMLSASVVTLLFNANFLMRFDGYYLLSDALRISNLYTLGKQALTRLSNRWLFGDKRQRSDVSVESSWFITAYGLATWVWRIMVAVTLMVAASRLLAGAGLILAVPTFLLGIAGPLRRTISRLFERTSRGLATRRYWLTRFVPTLSVTTLLLFVCPWPFLVSAPAVVNYHQPEIIRATTPGFVQSVHVREGQQVADGDLLISLENKELEIDRRKVELDLQACQLRARQQHEKSEIAAYQAELALQSALATKLAELDSQLQQLQLRAPVAGTIIGSDLPSMRNCRIEKGEPILQIVAEEAKELTVSIAQADFEPFQSAVTSEVEFAPSCFQPTRNGRLVSVQPTATLQCDPRLTSLAGGSLAVREAADDHPHATQANGIEKKEHPSSSTELLTPRFEGTIEIDAETSRQLLAGSTVHVRLDRYGSTIANHLWVWFREQFGLAREGNVAP